MQLDCCHDAKADAISGRRRKDFVLLAKICSLANSLESISKAEGLSTSYQIGSMYTDRPCLRAVWTVMEKTEEELQGMEKKKFGWNSLIPSKYHPPSKHGPITISVLSSRKLKQFAMYSVGRVMLSLSTRDTESYPFLKVSLKALAIT